MQAMWMDGAGTDLLERSSGFERARGANRHVYVPTSGLTVVQDLARRLGLADFDRDPDEFEDFDFGNS